MYLWHCPWRISYDGYPIVSTGQYGWAFGTPWKIRNCLLGCDKGVKERYSPICLIPFHCKLDCWIYIINMIQKFLFMCLFLDDPCVIHKPKPSPGALLTDLRAFLSKQIAQIGNYWTYRWPHRHSFNLLIKLVLERKVSIMQTEPQQFYDVLNW